MAIQNVSFIRPQEVVEGDSTTVRYRGYNGEQTIATSAQLDEVKANLEKVLDSLKSADFANGIPALSWAETKYAVTLTLSHATCDNTDARTSGSYSCTLAAEATYTLTTVAVTMGGTDITSTAYNSDTKKVSIANVTGAIAITATGTK